MPAMDLEVESGEGLLVVQGSRRRLPWRLLAGLTAGAALVAAPAALALVGRPGHGSVDAVQQQVEVLPKMQDCASPMENCFDNKCCKVSGQSCWHIREGIAMCGTTCPRGSQCFVEKPFYAFKGSIDVGSSLYCFTLAPTMKGDELVNTKDFEILQYQAEQGTGIFACNDHVVFSDKAVELGHGAVTVQVPVPPLYGKIFRQDKPDHYVNTPIFMEAWKYLKTEQKFMEFDWVVKVDPPTVFFPQLLRGKLPKQDASTGTYLVNCPGVLEGYFGSLEVVSRGGFKRFLEQFESFSTSSCWKWEGDDCKKRWKYGPWGEDLFMQRCMDSAEVGKLEDFSMVNTGTCPKMRPVSQKHNQSYVPTCTPGMDFAAVHPFRTKALWEDCFQRLK